MASSMAHLSAHSYSRCLPGPSQTHHQCLRPASSSSLVNRLPQRAKPLLSRPHAASEDASQGAEPSTLGPNDTQIPLQQDYKPFPRIKESDPYRRLGVAKEASFEEVVEAKNYLWQHYKWHEPSRESIELAFDGIMQEKLKARHKHGFRVPVTGKKGGVIVERRVTLQQRLMNLFDPMVTIRTIINEMVVYAALAIWALCASDQSFPLAGGFAYSVYKFQSKRVKQNPDGPFFAGNPMVGALISTIANLGLACGVMAVVTTPIAGLLGSTMRQVGGCGVLLVMGLLNVYLK